MTNFAYRFKPAINFNSVKNMGFILLVIAVVVLGKNIINFINGIFQPFKKGVKTQEGEQLQNVIDRLPDPPVDTVRMAQKFNQLNIELRAIWGTSGKKLVQILGDCTTAEKNWIYKEFGVRVYQRRFFDKPIEIDLFGWFDRQLSKNEIKELVTLWQNTKPRYVPIYGERIGL